MDEISSQSKRNTKHPNKDKITSKISGLTTEKSIDSNLKPVKASKERLFDPISKKYIKPKNKENNPNDRSKKDTKEGNLVSKANNHKNQSNLKSTNKKNQSTNDKNSFPPHYIHEMVEKGLKDGLLIEGTLRINPKNYEDAFVTNEMKNEPDIYIGGMMNRNRALNGDEVVVDILPESEWKVNTELVDEYLLENDLEELPPAPSHIMSENNSDMIVKFKRLGIRLNLNKDKQNLDDSVSYDDTEIDSSSNYSTSIDIEKNLKNVKLDTSSTEKSNTNGICVPIEELEEADFDEQQNSTFETSDIQNDLESIASSDGADVVIDDITEVYENESNSQINVEDSVDLGKIKINNYNSDEKSNQEKKHKTRRKRGSKKTKKGSKYKYF